MVGSHPDHPGLVQIYKSPDKPVDRYENSWHCDATWREIPPMGCVLRCVECPPVGGDTMWANMALAYERLPEQVKAVIDPLRARHSIECTFGAAMPIEKRLALKAQYPDAEHPVVPPTPKRAKKYYSSAVSLRISPTSTRPPMCVWDRTSRRAHPACCST